MKAALVIDYWKLPIFIKELKKDNFKYEVTGIIIGGTITLNIETDSADRLLPTIKRAKTIADNWRPGK